MIKYTRIPPTFTPEMQAAYDTAINAPADMVDTTLSAFMAMYLHELNRRAYEFDVLQRAIGRPCHMLYIPGGD